MQELEVATYDNDGLTFHYPLGWEVEETGIHAGCGSVQLTAPSGAFWIVTLHPFGTSPEKIADDVLRSLKREYRDLEFEPAFQTIGNRSLTGYQINFFYLDLTNTASILCFADETTTYGFFWQCGDQMVVGDDEPVAMEEVLGAITYSFLKSFTP